MPFDQGTITAVNPPLRKGGEVFLSWTSSAPTGTPFQIYVNHALAWSGQRLWAWVPVPAGPVRIDLGAVGVGEETIDFTRVTGFGAGGFGSGTYGAVDLVPSGPNRRALLTWSGGSYLGASLAGFHVYGEATPGGGINYAAALATITAYPAGIDTSGFGMGAFGSGGFGAVAGTYTWQSDPLPAGTWHFGIKPFDTAGNEGTAATVAATIASPPRQPAAYPDQTFLRSSLAGYGSGGFGSGVPFGSSAATLTWQPGPA